MAVGAGDPELFKPFLLIFERVEAVPALVPRL
jgi:hypothetical protein